MQFLIGLILGCAIAVGMMSSEESRLKLLQGMTHLINKVEQLAADSGLPENQTTASVVTDLVAQKAEKPVADDQFEPVAVESDLVNPVATQNAGPEDTADPVSSAPAPEIEPLFQVAWSSFRSETSAKGFATRLESQIAQKFRVIKTGPGRYEVGFLFASDPERSRVLKAIREITGYEPTTPPRNSRI